MSYVRMLGASLMRSARRTTHTQAAWFSTASQTSDENLNRFKRLLYQSQQRGWLELDLIMGTWVKDRKDVLINDAHRMTLLENICKEENSDLMRWLCEGRPVPEKYNDNPVMKDILEYALSPNKPWAPRVGQGNQ